MEEEENGWDAEASIVIGTNPIQVEVVSLNGYDDIGLERSEDGYVKCFAASPIDMTGQTAFVAETDISSWVTADAQRVKTD